MCLACVGCLYLVEGKCTNDLEVSVLECYRPRRRNVGVELEYVRAMVANMLEAGYAFTVSAGPNVDGGGFDFHVQSFGKCPEFGVGEEL